MDTLTEATETVTLVTLRGATSTSAPVPALPRGPIATDEPSLNEIVAPVIWSSRFGRSNSTTRSTVRGESQVSRIHAPARSPFVTHSRVASPG